MSGESHPASTPDDRLPLVYHAIWSLVFGSMLLVTLGFASAVGFLWLVHFRRLPTWMVSAGGLLLGLGSLLAWWRSMRFLARRRYQFSLRAAILAITVLALMLGLAGNRAKFAIRQRKAILALWQHGDYLNYNLDVRDSAWFRGLIKQFGFAPFGTSATIDIMNNATLDVVLTHREEFADVQNVLFCSGISDQGLERVAELNSFTRLQTVNFLSTSMTDASVKRLAGWTNVRSIMLNSCPTITDAGLAPLATLPKLEHLFLVREGAGTMLLTDAGLIHVGKMEQLRTLTLSGLPFTDAGLAHLRDLKRLERLSIGEASVTDAGLEHLKVLTRLEALHLRRTRVTDEGVKRLQESLPDCKITR